MVYESNELKVQLFHPEGWERLPYNDHQFDLRESAGEGWIEIKVIDQESDHLWGLDYIPSTQAKDLLNTLLDAARQDGSFADPQPLLTPSGRTIWISTGEYDLLNDQVMIGIHGLPDRAIVALGHSEIEAGEWDRLAPIYEAIIASIETK